MKALILAAGRGTRIQSVHSDCPKCLIQFNGSQSTILDHQIQSLFSAGITDIGIVVGYEKDQIIQHVLTLYRERRRGFSFIENPAFAKTNNIYSLWLARTWLNGDPFVCLNGDVVFDPQILLLAVRSYAPVTMVVDPKWHDDLQSEFSSTCIGITSFAPGVQQALFAKIDKLIRSGSEDESLNVAVQQLADERFHVGFTSTGDLPWAEIDDPGDLAFARVYVFPRLASPPAAA
jgi:choline kinase